MGSRFSHSYQRCQRRQRGAAGKLCAADGTSELDSDTVPSRHHGEYRHTAQRAVQKFPKNNNMAGLRYHAYHYIISIVDIIIIFATPADT